MLCYLKYSKRWTIFIGCVHKFIKNISNNLLVEKLNHRKWLCRLNFIYEPGIDTQIEWSNELFVWVLLVWLVHINSKYAFESRNLLFIWIQFYFLTLNCYRLIISSAQYFATQWSYENKEMTIFKMDHRIKTIHIDTPIEKRWINNIPQSSWHKILSVENTVG